MKRRNPLLGPDSYKFSQYDQIDPDTSWMYSYIESRGGKFDRTLFFGRQYLVREFLSQPFTKYDIDEAEPLILEHGEPFNRQGFEYILNKHGGYWPVLARSVPEGMIVPGKNLLMDCLSTDDNVPWVPDFLETDLMRIWFPTTVATQEYEILKVITKYLMLTAEPAALDWVGVKHNDFGSRGVSSYESSVIGGLAHLICFTGTDNVPALVGARDYYDAKKVAGYSIPASQHSTMTSWGDRPGELKAMRNMLNKFAKPGAFVACVSDSYDLWNAIENYWCGELLQQVKDSGAVVVVRPDSGHPVATPVRAINLMMEKVGFTVNSKGYKMLPPYFRVIQGDGIDLDSIKKILFLLESLKISTDNIAFGMGGAMLQKCDRDTQSFAMKCSAIGLKDGTSRDVFKDPITDPGKISKKGRLDLIRERDGNLKTIRNNTPWTAGQDGHSVMELCYCNGKIYNETTLDEIRDRVKLQLKEELRAEGI